MIFIGIDTGTHTGVAVWDSDEKKFLEIKTLMLHQALNLVTTMCQIWHKENVMVLFEDARQRKWFGAKSDAKMQGAGSVKRDASIWEEFCSDNQIAFRALPPVKGATKLDPDYFKALTGWTGKTSEHARDAAMIVFGR
jgi:hypothetical protein